MQKVYPKVSDLIIIEIIFGELESLTLSRFIVTDPNAKGTFFPHR